MKTLLIMRHAEATMHSDDKARTLSERGVAHAKEQGEFIKGLAIPFDLILHSSATRTTETAHIVGEILEIEDEKYLPDDELYLASKETLVYAAQGIHENFQHVLLVGHNPGLTEYVNYLDPMFLHGLATGEFVVFNVSGTWQELSRQRVNRK